MFENSNFELYVRIQIQNCNLSHQFQNCTQQAIQHGK